jgi:hypothetical protein
MREKDDRSVKELEITICLEKEPASSSRQHGQGFLVRGRPCLCGNEGYSPRTWRPNKIYESA